jgi:hypothetical protein
MFGSFNAPREGAQSRREKNFLTSPIVLVLVVVLVLDFYRHWLGERKAA